MVYKQLHQKIHSAVSVFILLMGLLGLSALTQAAVKPLALNVGKGELIRLNGDAKTVFISDSSVANYQLPASRSLFIFAKKPGVTEIFVLDSKQRTIYQRQIEVRHNLEQLNSQLQQELSEQGRNQLNASAQGNNILLTGLVDSSLTIEAAVAMAKGFVAENGEVINRIKVDMAKQVNIRLRIAEVKREVGHQLGIRWGTLINGSIAFDRRLVTLSTRELDFGQDPLSGVLQAMANEGLAKVLAEPNLTALSGETAHFHAGGEYPYAIPLPQLDTYSIDFREFGIKLDMQPTVLEGNRIRLKVRPEVSNLSTEVQVEGRNLQLPSLQVRSAESTIELQSGESFALAGLIQANDVSTINKLPFLGDIPVLGALFRSQEFRREETELVIIVSAYAVEPQQANEFVLPGEGLKANSLFEQMLWGKSHKNATGKTTDSTIRLWGNPDFIY